MECQGSAMRQLVNPQLEEGGSEMKHSQGAGNNGVGGVGKQRQIIVTEFY